MENQDKAKQNFSNFDFRQLNIIQDRVSCSIAILRNRGINQKSLTTDVQLLLTLFKGLSKIQSWMDDISVLLLYLELDHHGESWHELLKDKTFITWRDIEWILYVDQTPITNDQINDLYKNLNQIKKITDEIIEHYCDYDYAFDDY